MTQSDVVLTSMRRDDVCDVTTTSFWSYMPAGLISIYSVIKLRELQLLKVNKMPLRYSKMLKVTTIC